MWKPGSNLVEQERPGSAPPLADVLASAELWASSNLGSNSMGPEQPTDLTTLLQNRLRGSRLAGSTAGWLDGDEQNNSGMDMTRSAAALELLMNAQIGAKGLSGRASPAAPTQRLGSSSTAGGLGEVLSRHQSFSSAHNPWAANAASGSLGLQPEHSAHSNPHLELLIQSFSPKVSANGSGVMYNGNLHGQSSGGGGLGGLVGDADTSFQAAAAVDALFGVGTGSGGGAGLGSTNLTPRSSLTSLAPLLEATGLVGSPARNSPLSQSFTLGCRDPRTALFNNSFGGSGRHRAPSKLRHGSSVVGDQDLLNRPSSPGLGNSAVSQSALLGSVSGAIDLSNLPAHLADSSGSQPSEPSQTLPIQSNTGSRSVGGSKNHSLSHDASAYIHTASQQKSQAGAQQGQGQGVGAGTGNNQQRQQLLHAQQQQQQQQQQLQAMYMAMYGYGMQPGPAATMMQGPMFGAPMLPGNFGAAGYPATPGTAAYPGGPLDPASMMAMQQGMDPLMANAMHAMPYGMPPVGLSFPPVSPAEYAAYYQQFMENQAVMAAAMGIAPGQGMVPGMQQADMFAMQGGRMPDAGVGLDGMSGQGRNAGRGQDRRQYAGSNAEAPAGNEQLAGFMERMHLGQGGNAGQGGHQRRNSRRENEAGNNMVVPRGSVLLEEFKVSKTRRWEFSDLFGHMFEFSLDQHGSRFIQQKLETVPNEELAAALNEILPRVLVLMNDVFGNFVVQKFFEHGTLEQRQQLADAMKGQVLPLSLQMYGCRVVQKALEVLPVDTQCSMMTELDGNVMRCVRDQNGNHVIQKVIECVPTPRITALLDNFLPCVVPLSCHPFGCRVIQRILEHCLDAGRRGIVMDEILRSAHQLSQDQYGNYVVQHVLEHGCQAHKQHVVSALAPHVVQLSMHKFASNVIEACLTHCTPTERDGMIRTILGTGSAGAMTVGPEGGEPTPGPGLPMSGGNGSDSGEGAAAQEDALQQMMKDQFGNYVVQKVLEVCDDAQREHLLGRVRAQLHLLKKYTYGKHIVARVEKLLSAGTKIQTHLRTRQLPNDSQPLSSITSHSSQPMTSSEGNVVDGKPMAAAISSSTPSPHVEFSTGDKADEENISSVHDSHGSPGNPMPPAIPTPNMPVPPRHASINSPPAETSASSVVPASESSHQ